jgi:hypothetical protein
VRDLLKYFYLQIEIQSIFIKKFILFSPWQSSSGHSAHFLCLSFYGAAPDKTHFPSVMFIKERVWCKLNKILHLKADAVIVKEISFFSMHPI